MSGRSSAPAFPPALGRRAPQPAQRVRRQHPGLHLGALIVAEALAVVGLTRLGGVERWHVDWPHLWAWLQGAPLGDAFAGLLRWAMLVLAWWLLVSSLLYCLARLTRVPSLVRGAGWLTVPFVRFAVDRALVVTLAASTVVGARGAAAVATTSAPPSARAPVAAAPAPGWTHGTGSARSSAPTPLPQIETIAAVDAAPPSTAAAVPSRAELAPATEHEVRQGDNLWSIAAAHLAQTSGRPESDLQAAHVAPYWWSVCELNRPALRSGHPSLIYAGEVIRLPGVAADGEGFVATSPTSARAVSPVAPPPVPETTATRTPPSTAPQTTTTSTSTSSTTSSTSSTVAPAPAPPPPAAAPRGPTPASTPSNPTGASTQGSRPILSVSPWAMRAALAGALGLPAFALAGWLSRLRRGRAIQASRARPGRDVVRPEPEVEPLERAARVIAADQTEEWIEAALRALTAALGDVELAAVPGLRCVRAGDMGLEVLWARPFPTAPEGWQVADGGHVWRLDPDVELGELQRRGGDYAVLAPALVSLGASPEGPILADLEGFGALAVEGDVDRVRAFVRGAALELSSASWSEGVLLRVYGLDGFGGLAGVTATDGAVLVREVASLTSLFTPGLEASGSLLAARAAAGLAGEPWYPMVVLVGADADAVVVSELVELAKPGSGVAVAGMLGRTETDWRLIVGPDGAAVLKPLDMGMRMAGVADGATPQHSAPAPGPAAEGMATAALGREAPAPTPTAGVAKEGPVDADARWRPASEPAAGLVVDQAGLDETAIGLAVGAMVAVGEEDDIAAAIPIVTPPRAGRGRLRRERDCDVWVAILGPTPEIRGMATSFRSRRRLIEVLAYLAVYGAVRPVQGEQLRTDCWPPRLAEEPAGPARLREITPKSFHQGMSRLRAILGQGANGWHIPPAVDGAYCPGADVGCDWTLFQALAASGAACLARQDTARAIALYREALELVWGEPFSAVPGDAFAWAEAKHLVTDIRLAVAKVAHDLASLTRESDPATALWATQQGLLLLPTQLGLFDQAMAASAELGDVAGLERTFAAMCWAHGEIDPDAGVPAETSDLYRHLLARAKEATRVQA